MSGTEEHDHQVDDAGDGPPDGTHDARNAHDDRVQAGLDHLQRAAHEVIAASRALLDVAEDLVDDPRAASSLVDLLGSVAAMARPGARRGHRPVDGDDRGEHDDDDDPPVQRIPVS